MVVCYTSTSISHRYTHVPSLANLPTISLPIPPFYVVAEPPLEFPESYSKFPLQEIFLSLFFEKESLNHGAEWKRGRGNVVTFLMVRCWLLILAVKNTATRDDSCSKPRNIIQIHLTCPQCSRPEINLLYGRKPSFSVFHLCSHISITFF